MKIDLKQSLELLISVITVGTIIFKLGEFKSEIDSKIENVENELLDSVDDVKDSLDDRLHNLELLVRTHLTEYNERCMFNEYRFKALQSLIEHKFNRIANWVIQIADFLDRVTKGFRIKDDKY